MKRARTKDASSPAAKKSKSTIVSISKPVQEKDDNGDVFWPLSAKRRATISHFKGTTLVSLREYYQKDGKDLPGRQGISLTVEQFTALVLAVPDIKRALAGAGVEVEVDQDWEKEGEVEGKKEKKVKAEKVRKVEKTKKAMDKFVVDDDEDEEDEEEEVEEEEDSNDDDEDE